MSAPASSEDEVWSTVFIALIICATIAFVALCYFIKTAGDNPHPVHSLTCDIPNFNQGISGSYATLHLQPGETVSGNGVTYSCPLRVEATP